MTAAPEPGAAGAARRGVPGALLVIAGYSLFAVMDGLSKLLAADYPVVQIVWARYVAFLVLVTAVLWPRYGRSLIATRRPWAQFGRGLLPIAGSLMIVGAFRTVPLVEVTALMFLVPLFTVALAIPLLGERVSIGQWLALLVGFVGVLVVIRPGGVTFQWPMLLPLGTAFTFALYQIVTRQLGRTESMPSLLYAIAWVGAAVMSLIVPFAWVTPDLRGAGLMALSGLVLGLGHLCIIAAFARGPAAGLAPFSYFQIVASTLIGVLVFGEVPDLWAVLGTALIIGAGIYVWRSPAKR
ncbi:MAG TPA: DMT family transporter [Alphaproteobacteria bacterium]|nr:DMT family transporter [Alphaproteobacteria bacterium]